LKLRVDWADYRPVGLRSAVGQAADSHRHG